MRTILEELYYGNIHPEDRKEVDFSYAKECVKYEDQLHNLLNENEQEVLRLLLEAYDAQSSYEAASAFSYGFKLATLFMGEAYSEPLW